ncbi:helix-turn-helix transcriptional regulator [Diaphorobacter aerolatus]|uniref:Helix-turn-helix transcriptional regulator n=2 Tax=Diaphorobacter aerolatus TaxID=1288495 RepID=A0A7H0GNZ0_9BURK|nr:helix-turn-helix transcriptional regulator [Diaphorobacter aerolatus]
MTAGADATKQREAMAVRLKEAREYLGLSQDDVAITLGISRPAVTNIESGNRKVEAVELDRLAKLYGRPVNYFLSGETKEVSEKVAFYARTFRDLSEKDLDEVARFAEFLRASGTGKKATTRKPK